MKQLFPIFSKVKTPFCYLDTAATSHKPQVVIDAMTKFYTNYNANVHRSSYYLARAATELCEEVRSKVKKFINASITSEIIFTSGATMASNLVVQGLKGQLKANDLILIDINAHHSTLVPWQQLATLLSLRLKPIPIDDNGILNIEEYEKLLKLKPKVVVLTHVTNITGVCNPIAMLIGLAKQVSAITIVDGAQAVAHISVNVKELGCDFYFFSGHKMYGPTGVGILYGSFNELDKLIPFISGGEMVDRVTFTDTTFQKLPLRLEAGTPPIAEIIGLGAAIDFLQLYKDKIQQNELYYYLYEQLKEQGATCYGFNSTNIANIAFNIPNIHYDDITTLLDQQGIAIRSGAHCASPLIAALDIKGCCRASIGIYNNKDDIDYFIQALIEVVNLC